ncbi:MAG: hypothetical protein IQL11_09775 [Bacteroidales bacterium]|nr:hypothetical protein [Bacteroidales bacterium]
MPRTGAAIPETRMKPRADPARSLLYVDADTEPLSPDIVSSRNTFPVITAGRNPVRIIMMTASTGELRERYQSTAKAMAV